MKVIAVFMILVLNSCTVNRYIYIDNGGADLNITVEINESDL